MGITVNQQYLLHHLSFADDRVIIVQENEDVAYLTREVLEKYKKRG